MIWNRWVILNPNLQYFFCFRTRLEVLSPSPDVCFWWLGARPSRQPCPLDRGSRWRSHSVNFTIYMQRVKKKSFLQLLFLKWDDKLMKQILHFVPILAFFLSCRHHPSHWWQHEGEVLMAGGARGWRRWVDFIAFCLFCFILTGLMEPFRTGSLEPELDIHSMSCKYLKMSNKNLSKLWTENERSRWKVWKRNLRWM